VRALIQRQAPLDAILAFDLTNEVASRRPAALTLTTAWSLRRTAGPTIWPIRRTSGCGGGLVYWIDRQRAAIRDSTLPPWSASPF